MHDCIHVVCFRDRGWWVAQCLEHNLATSSKDPRELTQKLEIVLKVQVEADLEAGRTPFSALPRAPRRFWTLFESAEPWGPDESEAELTDDTTGWAELVIA